MYSFVSGFKIRRCAIVATSIDLYLDSSHNNVSVFTCDVKPHIGESHEPQHDHSMTDIDLP